MIHFNLSPFVGNETEYIKEALEEHKVCGDGKFTKKCSKWLEDRFGVEKVLLTTSGTAALEMASILSGIGDGDEVILPSYTFSSTANAFVLTGARLVFVDIDPQTMNIDERIIEDAITERTRCICIVHYAGVSCDMDAVMDLARKHGLCVIEDAAQAIFSRYKGRPLGTIGDFGCLSFHETKNLSMGEGGALLINDKYFVSKAEILREKGTNRSMFFRGEVAKYNWVDFGSSYLPSDILAAYLWSQLEIADDIQSKRMEIWNKYKDQLAKYENRGIIELPVIPEYCEHNAHMFWIKFKNLCIRDSFIKYMKDKDIKCVFHYVPLHSAPAGQKFGKFFGTDRYTTVESDKLVRLPLYYNMTEKEVEYVVTATKEFLETELLRIDVGD